MRVRVRERAETVVVFLTSRIPESELNVLAIDLDIGDVVLEDSGNVHLDTSRSVFYEPPDASKTGYEDSAPGRDVLSGSEEGVDQEEGSQPQGRCP